MMLENRLYGAEYNRMLLLFQEMIRILNFLLLGNGLNVQNDTEFYFGIFCIKGLLCNKGMLLGIPEYINSMLQEEKKYQ